MKKELIDLAIFKAMQSTCCYKVSAIGLNSKGDVLGASTNQHRISKLGMGLHAEIALVKRFGRKIRSMIICRVGGGGEIRPINPCPTCQKILDKMGIRVLTVSQNDK